MRQIFKYLMSHPPCRVGRLVLSILIWVLAGCNHRQTNPSATYLPSSPIPQKTTNATPSSWTPHPALQSGSPIQINSMHMFDSNTGWAIESTGHIVRTQDGGNTWRDVTPTQDVYQKGGFFALDLNTAWATPNLCMQNDCLDSHPASTRIWHTTDGGAIWKPSQALCLGWSSDCGYYMDVGAQYSFPDAMQFLNERAGWLILSVNSLMFQDRYRLFQTVDGGHTWRHLMGSGGNEGPLTSDITGIAYQDMQTGWLGTNDMYGAMEPSHTWSIYKTQDGGHTWGPEQDAKSIELPVPPNLPDDFTQKMVGCGVVEVSAIPPDVVDLTFHCSVYKDYVPRGPDYYYHFHSVDGGQTWRSWRDIGAAKFIDSNLGWRLVPGSGQSNFLQKTADGGLTWTTLRILDWQRADFDFVNDQAGWAIASNGDTRSLWQTYDSGKSWSELHPIVEAR